jgi:hypothetical protein
MRAVRSMMPAHSEFLAEIRTTTVDHLSSGSIAEAQGRVMGARGISMRGDVPSEAVTATDLGEWYGLLWRISEQLAEQQTRHLFAAMEQVTSEVGNTVDVRGGQLSHDALLDMFERMDMKVGDDGNPEGLTLVGPPGMERQLAALGPRTPEQTARYERIMVEKRRTQDAAKRIRRLDRRAQ